MDVVTLFAIIVFGAAWIFLGRTPQDEPLSRLFFGTLMLCAAGAGMLSVVLRLMRG